MKKKCYKCGKPIPKARLKALPDTKTCVKCSDVQPKMGVMIWDKSTPVLAIVDEIEFDEDGDI